MNSLDVLIPTCERPAALAVTLAGLAAQNFCDFRLVISDQSERYDPFASAEVRAVLRILESHGHPIELHRHLPRQGMAEHRQFLLQRVRAPYALFLDDDLLLEPWVIGLLLGAIRQEGCGVVGSPVIGLSYLHDERPHEQAIEFWEGAVEPETILPDTPAWERYRLHNAANPYHLQNRLGITPDRPRCYKIAWVGGAALFDAVKLRAVGGFGFWHDLGERHCGEDVLAQQRVMARFGGCGVLPTGIYHLELPTTLPDRSRNAPRLLGLDPGMAR